MRDDILAKELKKTLVKYLPVLLNKYMPNQAFD